MKILCLLLSLALLCSCAPTTAPDPSGASVVSGDKNPKEADLTEQALAEIRRLGTSPDDNYRTWYEIFLYSFCDSNGDGIGDLKGAASKLDYLQDLGITGIWLMPIHPSTTYHKYNVSDYYAIDPVYGTMEDFETFMDECTNRNIRVILDLVVNHSGSEHSWFREAVGYLQSLPTGAEADRTACPTMDYYTFVKAETCPAAYSAVTGAPGWFYESKFSYDMPDLNLANEALRQEIRSIMDFWLQKGVAGFRLDAAKEFYSGDAPKNIEVLRWLQETAVSLDPEAYLVAEVWDSFQNITSYYESGITSIFNYPFGNTDGKIVKVLRGAGQESVVSTYAEALQKADSAYGGSNPNYIDAPFLTNHDVGRVAGFVGRSAEKTKLAGAMNLFMSGSAFVYYGEELGMVCGDINDPSFRAPMLWNDKGDDGMTAPAPGCVLPEEYPMGSFDAQKNDDASVYNYYRQAIAIRTALPVIARGKTTVEQALNYGTVSAYRKTWGEESCIIVMNIADAAFFLGLDNYSDWKVAATLSANGEPVILREQRVLELPAYATAVLVPK